MLASITALAVAFACNDHPIEPFVPRVAADGTIVVDAVSGSRAPAAGEEIAIGLRASAEDSMTIDAVQTRLRWNPERLRWLGQAEDSASRILGTITVVNESGAESGELRLIGVNAHGLGERFAALAFEVLSASWREGVSIEVEEVIDSEGRIRDTEVRSTIGWDGALVSMTGWSRRDDKKPAVTVSDGPRRVPGESEVYGDATLEGAIDSLDVVYASNISVGNHDDRCIVGTDAPARDCLAVNVRPANPPGLGGPSDPCPPGLEECGGFERVITASDVAAIADEASGDDQEVVGEPIPDMVVGDTVFVLGVITGTRLFTSDSVYVLLSDVVIGASVLPGELVVEAGTEIRGSSGAALIVSRNGRILAEGTSQAPVRMMCHETAPDPGCWEGLVIAGNAPVNAGEEGLGSAPVLSGRNDAGGGNQRSIAGVLYGGSNAADSSGVLTHVVVEHAGEAGRGIALAGVGSGTVVEGIHSNRSGTEGIEVLGGAVDLGHVLVTGPAASALTFSLGHGGSVQYVAVQMDPDATDAAAIRVTNAPGEPAATPVTAPALWNVTVVGGTSFFRKHTAVSFEDAAGLVRNALWVQTAVGVEANAGACGHFSTNALDVDHVVMLGTTEAVRSQSCASGLVAHLEAGEADGLENSRAYMGDLEDPFDGELLDLRPVDTLATSATPATPTAGLDPAGEHFGAVNRTAAAPGTVPWYTGWSGVWERPDGFASLPEPVGFTDVFDTLLTTDSAGYPVYRRAISLRLLDAASREQIRDLFETFGLEIVGSLGTGHYYVFFPDPGTDITDYLEVLLGIRAHPAVDIADPIGGSMIRLGRFPIDGVALSRSAWDPSTSSDVDNWKSIRAPQAWACEAGLSGTTAARAAVVEWLFGAHADRPGAIVTVDGFRAPASPNDAAALELHGTAVAGQLGAPGDNLSGIAGMNWAPDLDLIRKGGSIQFQIANFAHAVDSARVRNVAVLSLSTEIGLGVAVSQRVIRAFKDFLDTDARNLIIKANAQRPEISGQPDLQYTNLARGMITRALDALVQDGYGGRILFVAGSDLSSYADSSFIYRSLAVGPTQVSAPFTHHVLNSNTGGTIAATGTSFGTPMVAGLATLLYQMKPDLTGAEVVDLIMDGAAQPEVFGDTLRVDSIMGLPTGSPTLHQLDAYGAMQLLSRRYPGAPICGLDVFAANDDVIILREIPQAFQVTDATYFDIGEVSVAPGGRTLAVSARSSDNFATRFYSVDGTHQADSVGIIRVQFLEKDTAYFLTDAVRIGGGTWIHLPGAGPSVVNDPFSASVSPEGTEVVYVTSGTMPPDSVQAQVRMLSNLGGTPVPSVLTDDRQGGVWSSYVRFMGTSWTDFGDVVLVSRFLEAPDETEFQVIDPSGPTATTLGVIGAQQAYGRMVPGNTHFKAVSVQGSDCMLQTRSLGAGVLVDSVDVTTDVPDCWIQWRFAYNRGLAPPRVSGR